MQVLQSERLSRAGYIHGFSLRTDDPAALLCKALHLDGQSLYQANQVHGARVLRAEGAQSDLRKTDADALVALAAPAAVGVRVADCVPVLVGALDAPIATAIHAGWRGVVQGVIAAALADARAAGARRFVAAIGPCIGACCFEVGVDVAAQIASVSHGQEIVARRAGDKAYVDLRRAVRAQLAREGLADSDIEDVAGCTKCDAARFFSFRRDGANAGRHLGVIVAR